MEVNQLKYNPRTQRIEQDGCGLHCGDCLEVLICDKDGNTRWVTDRIEFSDVSNRWYLVKHPSLQVNGLYTR